MSAMFFAEGHLPPPFVKLVFCHKCGRDNRWTPLKVGAKHFAGGSQCLGEPVEIPYVLTMPPAPEQSQGADAEPSAAKGGET